jgi:methanogenic corrinoid protein MtbC1
VKSAAEPGSARRYLDLALTGDVVGAVAVALRRLSEGASPEAVLEEVLVPAQREVGDRWHRNEIGVADEHVATGAAYAALYALADTVPTSPASARIVIGCAEGDWHALTTHILALQLRARGFAVTVLGASTPADHLARFLERHRPHAFAVSCSVPLYYSGVARLADAAHACDVPVLAGGRALGPERARRLGADGWAADAGAAARVLREWQAHRPPDPLIPTRLDAGALTLDVLAPDLAGQAMDALASAYPAMAGYATEELARTREDLVFIVRYVAAARLVDDPAVLTEFLDWLAALLAARQVPPRALVAGLEALRPGIADVDREAGRLVELGLRYLAT